MEIAVWLVAVFFLVSWPIAIWIKINRNEYYPRSMYLAVLWWIPEMWVVYKSGLSPFHLLWMMPSTAIVALVLDTHLLLRHPGRSGARDTVLIWVILGMLVMPVLAFI